MAPSTSTTKLLVQVAELNKAMEDMKSEHAFAMHRKTAELVEELKQVCFIVLPTQDLLYLMWYSVVMDFRPPLSCVQV